MELSKNAPGLMYFFCLFCVVGIAQIGCQVNASSSHTLDSGLIVEYSSDSGTVGVSFSGEASTCEFSGTAITVRQDEILVDELAVTTLSADARVVRLSEQGDKVTITVDGKPVFELRTK